MKEKQKEGSDEKQELANQREEKRLDNLRLNSLKAQGGPFTDEREVDAYHDYDDDIDEKEKVKQMKLEQQFPRNSSTLLPQD